MPGLLRCTCGDYARASLKFAREVAGAWPPGIPHAPIIFRGEPFMHTSGVEFMNRLVEIRRQEFICRERALLDSERKSFWLAKAEEWEQRALEEIAFHFKECNRDSADCQTAAH